MDNIFCLPSHKNRLNINVRPSPARVSNREDDKVRLTWPSELIDRRATWKYQFLISTTSVWCWAPCWGSDYRLGGPISLCVGLRVEPCVCVCVCVGPCLLMMNSGAKTLAVCESALISHLLCQPEALLISISLQRSACGLYVFVYILVCVRFCLLVCTRRARFVELRSSFWLDLFGGSLRVCR